MRAILFLLRCAFFTIALEEAAGFSRVGSEVVVSVPDQELAFIRNGKIVVRFPVSTSKFGLGDSIGSYRTPLGMLFVSAKFGDSLRPGSVIKGRVPTGEVLPVDAPSRDAIVSRIIWLRGLEERNQAARGRCIYIHGTSEERRIGKPASFGCIRMRSRDVIALYDKVHVGMHVVISPKRLKDLTPVEEPTLLERPD